MDEPKPIEARQFSRAEDFLDALAPRSLARRPEQWIYRGHGDSTYKLLPTARRPPELNKRMFPASNLLLPNQLFAEAEIVKQFYLLCDRRGIAIPGDNPDIRATFAGWKDPPIALPPYDQGVRDWPHPQLLPVVAAAQHHGLPTCLLDWTYRPYVAAFFAAHGAMRLKPTPETFSVWALDLVAFKIQMVAHAGQEPDRPEEIIQRSGLHRGPFEVVTVPSGTNERIRAQSGLFLLHRPSVTDQLPFTAWEDLLSKVAVPSPTSRTKATTALRHLVVSGDQAGEILRYLAHEDVTWSNLFPGMTGVCDEVKSDLRL